MENRTFSPIVLVGGLLVATLVGFVAARQLGDTAPAPTAAVDVAAGDAAGLPPELGDAAGATEALIEPLVETVAEAAPVAPQTAAPAAGARAATTRSAPVSPAAPARQPQRSASPVTQPSPVPAASRAPARPAPASNREATVPARTQERPAEVARQEPTWSRPFPAPEALESLPSRTAPRIDAPPPPPQTRTVTLAADSVVGLQLEQTISTDSAKVEDTVQARVTRDVFADGVMVIPAGTRVTGSVTLVDEGGKVRERARLGVRFHTLVLADGTELRLPTETIYRDGESPSGRSAAKIGGGATAGAVIGAILGGGKGAAIGAAIGAGSGTAATMAGGRRPATLPSGQLLTVRLSDAVPIEVPR